MEDYNKTCISLLENTEVPGQPNNNPCREICQRDASVPGSRRMVNQNNRDLNIKLAVFSLNPEVPLLSYAP